MKIKSIAWDVPRFLGIEYQAKRITHRTLCALVDLGITSEAMLNDELIDKVAQVRNCGDKTAEDVRGLLSRLRKITPIEAYEWV